MARQARELEIPPFAKGGEKVGHPPRSLGFL